MNSNVNTFTNTIVYSRPQEFCKGIYVTTYNVHISDCVEFAA